ncbi:MAG: ATP synthase F1 subunit gamma [Oscillospiraceae bacterium]
MAGGKNREIKLRMRGIQSTGKITKAMGLVASSKLGKAKDKVARSRPYFQILYKTLTDISSLNRDFSSPYTEIRTIKNSCFIVIGGDRGLAGGYNANIFKQAEATMRGKNAFIVPIGKKTIEYFERSKHRIFSKNYANIEKIGVGKCFEISHRLCDAFITKEFDEIYLVYTNFVSMLDQQPAALHLLPLTKATACVHREVVLYEPSAEAVYNAIVPEYLAGLLYGALCEALASELGARHTAMDSASKNAEEIMEKLTLQYNRARQSAITQEITEIVAGAGE